MNSSKLKKSLYISSCALPTVALGNGIVWHFNTSFCFTVWRICCQFCFYPKRPPRSLHFLSFFKKPCDCNSSTVAPSPRPSRAGIPPVRPEQSFAAAITAITARTLQSCTWNNAVINLTILISWYFPVSDKTAQPPTKGVFVVALDLDKKITFLRFSPLIFPAVRSHTSSNTGMECCSLLSPLVMKTLLPLAGNPSLL